MITLVLINSVTIILNFRLVSAGMRKVIHSNWSTNSKSIRLFIEIGMKHLQLLTFRLFRLNLLTLSWRIINEVTRAHLSAVSFSWVLNNERGGKFSKKEIARSFIGGLTQPNTNYRWFHATAGKLSPTGVPFIIYSRSKFSPKSIR